MCIAQKKGDVKRHPPFYFNLFGINPSRILKSYFLMYALIF
ncbi:hypothetical protein HME9304_03101 [Flagellimonas maritima]|uniref:Uncharacterized protein n=1 Tax=Flagellimonas maritima TaxID=1383885 RepID=A0A2Z4LWF0_9FLAO|nr:hypothetical protein HME9304_03101 [Allomuricauda aurantiaca]